MLGNILLTIVTICTLISYMPQVIKLIRSKNAESISVGSWVLWVTSSFVYLTYSVFCSNDFMLFIECLLEFLFCVTILALSVFYTRRG